MAEHDRSLSFQLSAVSTRTILALLIVAALSMRAQTLPATQPGPQAQPSTSSTAPAGEKQASITVPGGTPLPLVLTQPIDSKSNHRGDEIRAQTTAPVVVGDRVAIPAGTFIQGTIEKLSRKGTSGEFALQSLSVLSADGRVTTLNAPMTIRSDEGTVWRNPSSGAKAGAIAAPIAGLGLGALIGSAAHTTQSATLGGNTITTSSPKGVAIGSGVGLAAGAIVSLALLLHSNNFYVDAGSPMQLILPEALTLPVNQAAAASSNAQSQVVPQVWPAAPRQAWPAAAPSAQKQSPATTLPTTVDTGVCFTPGIPGTSIPGDPANGIPGTYIPDTPPTPHPCP